jgi:hypothetical protein
MNPYIVEKLRGTRPWVVFLAIVGFLFSGLFLLAGFGAIAAGAIVTTKAGMEPWIMAAAGAFYLVIGGVYVIPCVGMIRFGSSIGDLIREPRMERLGAAMDRERWFWKASGIIVAVFLALQPIGFVALIAIAAAKGAK